jgi:hypothetical protein
MFSNLFLGLQPNTRKLIIYLEKAFQEISHLSRKQILLKEMEGYWNLTSIGLRGWSWDMALEKTKVDWQGGRNCMFKGAWVHQTSAAEVLIAFF